MSDIFAIKRAQQEEHLKQLREAPKEARNKLALRNSGFASFLGKNGHLIKIRFSG